MPKPDERETVDTMADRVGRALGSAIGMRFDVLANLNKERDAGSPVRTISIVDRWAIPNFVLTVEDEPTAVPSLLNAVENLIEAIADARDRGEDIPDWLDQAEDVAIDARQKMRGGSHATG